MPLAKNAEKYRGRSRRARAQLELERSRIAPAQVEATAPGGSLADFVQWAEQTLIVPTGLLRGERFQLYGWQREFLEGALAPGIREAGLSIARKNAKTGLIAALVLGYLVGPLRFPMWRGIAVSETGVLAGELRRAITEIADASGLSDQITVKQSPPPGTVKGLDGSELTLLASDRASGHAVGADVCLIDEAGLIPESRRPLWNAVLSSVSGRDGRLIAFSIRGDSPMFSELAARADDPSVHWTEYAADGDAQLDDVEQWHKANPGLGTVKGMSYMEDASRRALATPADGASFRAYDLNQPGAPTKDLICDVQDWMGCVVEDADLPERDGLCVVGLDAGGSSSMTCAVGLWPRTGRMEAWAAFPAVPDLRERGRNDGVGSLYEQMEERSELEVYPGRVTPVASFLLSVDDALKGERVVAIGADRYRRAEVEGALTEAGLRWPIEWRGQGASATADGSHDVRAFQRLVLGKQLKTRASLLMANAIRESEIRLDGSGNPALDKSRQKGRIDALSAGVIAAGLSEIWLSRNPARSKPLRLAVFDR